VLFWHQQRYPVAGTAADQPPPRVPTAPQLPKVPAAPQ
jgi:hypothetical protein